MSSYLRPTALLEARPRAKPLRAAAVVAAAMACAFAVAVWSGSYSPSPSSTADEAGSAAMQQLSSQPEPGPVGPSISGRPDGGLGRSDDSSSSSSSSSGDGSAPAAEAAEAAAGDDPFAAPTRLHGPQRKAGPLDPREWLQPYALERHAKYMEYLEGWEGQHGVNPQPSGELPPPQPVTFPTCQVWVNHQYGIAFLRHAKTGSTSVINWFGCDQGGEQGRRRQGCQLACCAAQRLRTLVPGRLCTPAMYAPVILAPRYCRALVP